MAAVQAVAEEASETLWKGSPAGPRALVHPSSIPASPRPPPERSRSGDRLPELSLSQTKNVTAAGHLSIQALPRLHPLPATSTEGVAQVQYPSLDSQTP